MEMSQAEKPENPSTRLKLIYILQSISVDGAECMIAFLFAARGQVAYDLLQLSTSILHV